MTGSVRISRAIFDHECFADEPMTEREAWVWLIMEASWKPRKKRVGDFIVALGRGQLAASVRFMAGAWKWTPAKVQRFLDRLKKLEMITTKTDTGVTVITLCNYNDYQSPNKAADTGPIQDRYRSDTNENKDEIKVIKNPPTPQGGGFADFWNSWPNQVAEVSAERAWKKVPVEDRPTVIAAAGPWFAWWRREYPDAKKISAATFLIGRRWNDKGFSAKPCAPVDIRSAIAERIKSGKAFLCGDITISKARDLIDAGLVTEEECRKVGIA